MAKSLFEQIVDGSLTVVDEIVLKNVKNIGDYAFQSCKTNLSNVTIPSNVISIGTYAFNTCNYISNISFNSGVESIGAYAFSYVGTQANSLEIILPNSLKSIGKYAFSAANLSSITIPSSVTSMGDGIFEYSSKLASVNLNASIPSIGFQCFYACTSLTNITIPKSVNYIGNYAFANSSGKMAITDVYFNQPSGMTITLPTAGSDTGMFYVKTARSMNVYTDNETIKNYAWSSDNITPTFYHLDGTLWE